MIELSRANHFINNKSELITFGDSYYNTTGMGYSVDHDLITPERIMQNMKLVNSSERIHLAVNNNGDLYSWAAFKYDYLLGRIVQYSGSPNNAHKLPGKVHNIEPIKYVGKPGRYDFIVVGESGRAYGAGRNILSALALGHQNISHVNVDNRVKELQEVAKGVRWKKIDFVDVDGVVGISEDNYAYFWGGSGSSNESKKLINANSFIVHEDEYNKEYTVYRKSGSAVKISGVVHTPLLISNERVKKVMYNPSSGLFVLLTLDGRLLTKGANPMYDIPENIDVVKSGIKKDMAYSERKMSRRMLFDDFIIQRNNSVIAIEKGSKKLYSFFNASSYSYYTASLTGIDFTKEENKQKADLIKQQVGEPWFEIGKGEKFEQLDAANGVLYALNSKGQIYGWGYSSQGRLANLKNSTHINEPTLLSNVKGAVKLRGYADEIVVTEHPEKDIIYTINIPLHKDFKSIESKLKEIEKDDSFIKVQYMAGVISSMGSTTDINAIIRNNLQNLTRARVNILGNYRDSEPIESFIETLNKIKNGPVSNSISTQYVTIYVIARVKESYEDRARKLFQLSFETDEVSLTSSGYGFSKIEEWRIDG